MGSLLDRMTMLLAIAMTLGVRGRPRAGRRTWSCCPRRSGRATPAKPEAEALAVRGGRIVAVGSDKEIAAWKGPKTVVLDGKWRRVVPGFIDSHTHMSMGGLNLLALDLRKTKDEADFTRQARGVREDAAARASG